MPIGLTLPFNLASGKLGGLDSSSTELEAARHNLRSLLLTNWGERPCHFYLGCNLAEYLFAPAVADLEDQIRERVVSQVDAWLPYIELQTIDVVIRENYIRLDVSFNMMGRADLGSRVEATVR